MRSIDRIPAILKELEEIWKEYPDLRLGQLLSNAVPKMYYTEDEELIKKIKDFYKEVK